MFVVGRRSWSAEGTNPQGVDGKFGSDTETATKAFQRLFSRLLLERRLMVE